MLLLFHAANYCYYAITFVRMAKQLGREASLRIAISPCCGRRTQQGDEQQRTKGTQQKMAGIDIVVVVVTVMVVVVVVVV